MVGGAEDESFVERVDDAADGLLVLLGEALEEGVFLKPGRDRGCGVVVDGRLGHGEVSWIGGARGFCVIMNICTDISRVELDSVGAFWEIGTSGGASGFGLQGSREEEGVEESGGWKRKWGKGKWRVMVGAVSGDSVGPFVVGC